MPLILDEMLDVRWPHTFGHIVFKNIDVIFYGSLHNFAYMI
uniref:Uncharacterized protein n=1 Tax=Anguilla anguilla TaxID=7936 RepID=A0A0E9T2T4_ANGAN